MKNRTVIRHSASVFALILGATTAQAQTAPTAMAAAEADEANAIIVTARRVNERLQDVPAAISVVTADDLRRKGIDDLMDVAQNTVGFAFEAISPLVVQTSREFGRRQDVPAVFDMTTIAYVADPEFVLSRDSIFQGRVKAVEIPPERAIDIDTLLDFEMAEFLMSRQLKPC